MRRRRIYNAAFEVEVDKQGRVLMPAKMVETLRPDQGGSVLIAGNRDPLGDMGPRDYERVVDAGRGGLTMVPSAVLSVFDVEMAMAHVPVLTEELLDALQPGLDSVVVDCTFGAGGHADAVGRPSGPRRRADRLRPRPAGPRYFEGLKDSWRCQSSFYLGNFADTLHQLNQHGTPRHPRVHGPGVSSMQVDTIERGFSYSYDAPLDMRMDPDHLADGEPTSSTNGPRIGSSASSASTARSGMPGVSPAAIVRNRQRAPYTRTAELVDTVKEAIPTPARFGSRNPARRVFQALRIAVNDELDSLRRALPEALELLQPGGVLAVISFHSLEDRIVKDFFVGRRHPCRCPPDFPVCVCLREPTMELVTHKALTPGPSELEVNPRSSSAKLRAATEALMGSRPATGSGARHASLGRRGVDTSPAGADLGLWYDAVGLRSTRKPQAGAPPRTERAASVPATRPGAATRPRAATRVQPSAGAAQAAAALALRAVGPAPAAGGARSVHGDGPASRTPSRRLVRVHANSRRSH